MKLKTHYTYNINDNLPYNPSFDYKTIVKELNESHHKHKKLWTNPQFSKTTMYDNNITISFHKHPILHIPLDCTCSGSKLSSVRNKAAYKLHSIYILLSCLCIQKQYRGYITRLNLKK